ncbi:MAG: fatty acid--CoA ligase [Sneathiellaceae bacterium]
MSDNGYRTMADIVRVQARLRGNKDAMRFNGVHLSYAQLNDRASQVANGLRGWGIGKGDRVAVLDKNDPSFFEIWCGAMKIGAVVVPVNWRLAPPEIAYVVNDAGARALFVGGPFGETVAKHRDRLQTVEHVVGIHETGPDGYAAWRDAQDIADPDLAIAPQDVAIQMYTSGTTGHPKGAQIMHANLAAAFHAGSQHYGNWSPDDVNLVAMPLFHIAGNGWGLVGFYHGATNIVMADIDPKEILRLIPEHRISKILFVPAVILFVLQVPGVEKVDFSSVDTVVYGASPIPVELVRQAVKIFGCEFVQVYGLTETCGSITFLGPDEHRNPQGDRLKSCGRPWTGVEVRIVDAEGKDQATGDVGEIICRTQQVMKGYWNLPEETQNAMRGDWFHTGDAGYLDADGYLYIYDRVKDMIVSGGENIYPAEIESALFGHPAIADIAVIGVPSERWGEEVKACIVLKPEQQMTADDLIAYARERIAGYKVPKSVDFMDALPRNPSGKLLKRELRKGYWEGQDRQVH